MRTNTRLVAGAIAAVVVAATLAAAQAPALAQPAPAVSTIDWKACPDKPTVDCGTVTVPIDWSRPRGATVQIALARIRATGPAARIGAILMDPGGPGGSGVDFVQRGAPFSPELHRRFDLVGFDPRGVGGSHPVTCDRAAGERPVPDVPRTPQEFQQMVDRNRAFGESCRRLTGPLFDFLDTKSVVRDMDAIRAALGEEKLTYYGLSYGTLMGQQYAEEFPRRIRAMVLDSNMDHSLKTAWQFLRTEATAAEEAFGQFVAWCGRNPRCALHGQDVPKVFADLYAKAERGELTEPGSDRKLDAFRLLIIANGTFYGPDWKGLSDMLAALSSGRQPDPAVAEMVRGQRARYGDTVHAPFSAIFCQDWRLPVRGFAELDAHRRALTGVAPNMRLSPLGWDATTGCIGYPTRVRNPQHPLKVRGAPPILMLNARYDPATTYEWATAAARQSGAVLLTYDGWGHGVYWKGSSCVTGATDRYLITGQAPSRGTHCPAVEPPDGTPPPSARQ